MFTITRSLVGDIVWKYFAVVGAADTSFSVSVLPLDGPFTVVDAPSLGLFQVIDKLLLAAFVKDEDLVFMLTISIIFTKTRREIDE
jgi:hypothetical protein